MEPQNASDQARLRQTESPRLRRMWGSRARRRSSVILYLALVLAGAPLLSGGIVVDLTEGLGIAALGALLAIFVAVAVLSTRLSRATRMSLPHRLLDERQRAERDTAHGVAHTTMGVLLTVVFVGAVYPMTFSPPEVVFPSWLVPPMLWTLMMVHISLPACYLAWTQPDEPLDDEDPDELP